MIGFIKDVHEVVAFAWYVVLMWTPILMVTYGLAWLVVAALYSGIQMISQRLEQMLRKKPARG